VIATLIGGTTLGLIRASAHAALGDLREVVSLLRSPVDHSEYESAAPPAPGTGTGLIGLAERVALANGRLEHAPTLTAAMS
jgi:hypothetical protein